MRSRRISVALALFVTVVINYLDRSNISIAAIDLSRDLQLTKVEMGLIFSAFAWSYSLCQIPGGLLADRVRPRVLYPILLTLWSLATIVQGFAGTVLVLVVCRVLIGVFEAPSYPINNRVVTSWFPISERAGAIGFYTSGQYLGLAVLAPVLVAFQTEFGWRALFYACGGAGIVWAWIWHAIYRDPDQDRRLGSEEKRQLEEGGAMLVWQGGVKATTSGIPSRAEWAKVLGSRQLWGLYLGQFCIGTVTIFFLTWFPTYLVESRGMAFESIGFAASLPFLAALFGVLISGFLSDWLMRMGAGAGWARKGPVLIGVALSSCMIGAVGAQSDAAVLAFMSIAFFGNGMASISWIFVSLLAPRDHVGLVGGVFNFIGGLSAAVTPLVIGSLVDGRNFSLALIYVGSIALLAIMFYTVVIGNLEPRGGQGDMGKQVE